MTNVHGTSSTKDGRNMVVRRITVTCKKCHSDFTSEYTTKAHKYCELCRPVAVKEYRARQMKKQSERRTEMRRARRLGATEEPRLVRFAGYDPSERPLAVTEGEQHDYQEEVEAAFGDVRGQGDRPEDQDRSA